MTGSLPAARKDHDEKLVLVDVQITFRRASNVLCSWKPDGADVAAVATKIGRKCRPQSQHSGKPSGEFCCQLTANIAEALERMDVAEGLLGRILGGEAEKPGVEVSETLASAEAFAAAAAAIASRQDPGVARKTVEFLSEKTQLLKVQKEHLKDEHAATGNRDLETTLWSV